MSKEIAAFYDRGVAIEWSRMDRHPLEFGVTCRHIDSLLGPDSRILDLGGGPGRYAFHYAARGHRISLVDLSGQNIAFARAKQAELGIRLEDLAVGNALSLPHLADSSFDLVLCMGPLYHLIDPGQRAQAIAECLRLVRPGGHAVFAVITTFAQTISVIKNWADRLDAWQPTLVRGIEQGINDTAFDTGFTEAWFADPAEVAPMVAAQGWEVLRVVGAEGLACQSEDRLKALPPDHMQRWIDFSWRYSGEPSCLGANQHVLCLARKS